MIGNRLTRWMAQRLLENLMDRVVYARVADVAIGGREAPYMLRWHIIKRNRVFNVYLHNVLRDDDDRALHDHPWPSLSICLDGHLAEYYLTGDVQRFRDFHPGDIVWRGARFAHRLYLPGEIKDAWTLFITGPRIRTWGFYCPQGWARNGWNAPAPGCAPLARVPDRARHSGLISGAQSLAHP